MTHQADLERFEQEDATRNRQAFITTLQAPGQRDLVVINIQITADKDPSLSPSVDR